jgi:TonB family protein
MKTFFVVLSALALAGCAETFGTYRSTETYATLRTPNDHIAQAWLLAEPEYPKAELAKGTTGYVVIDARVKPGGELVDVRMAPESSGPPVFVTAVNEAMPMWRFYPPLDQSCDPTEDRIKVRVWFEVENGKSKVSVQGEGPKWNASGQPQPLSTVNPLYPRKSSSFRWNDGVIVSAKATIDDQGNVVKTTARAYPRGLPWMMMSYEDQTRTAILAFKFPPVPPGSGAPRYYCTDAVFAAENNY